MTLGASRVMLQIVKTLTDDSRGVIYDRNMFIVKATWRNLGRVYTRYGRACLSHAITLIIKTTLKT
jgi:hypothetical protein